MLRTGIPTGLAIILIFLALCGCRSGPVMPETTPQAVSNAGSDIQSSHMNLGFYSLVVDTGRHELDVRPVRSSDIHLNVVGILNQTMGVAVALVPSESDYPNGLFAIDVTLSHPFAAKPQFSGFDVKGVLITPGSLNYSGLVFADADEIRLENADGFTRWWNPTEFTTHGVFGYIKGNLTGTPAAALTATVNPYKHFADILEPKSSLDLIVDEPLAYPQGRGVFTNGESNTRRYDIRFPMDPGPQIVFGYAVDCSWTVPVPNPPDAVPSDFPMEANQPEAYRVSLTDAGNCLYYDSETGAGGGFLKLEIAAYDWQGQNLGDIAGQIAAVRTVAPAFSAGTTAADFIDQTSRSANYLAYLPGSGITEAGETIAVCQVESNDGSTYKQAGAQAPEDPLSAYMAIPVTVMDPECTVDVNNSKEESIPFDIEKTMVDQLCPPTDYMDYYKLEIPLGHIISGSVTLWCDREPSRIMLFPEIGTALADIQVSGGFATVNLDDYNLMPGNYYFVIITQTTGTAFLYMLDPDIIIENVTPSSAVDVTPDDLYFAPRWFNVYSHYLYVSNGTRIWIYDYTDCVGEYVNSIDLEQKIHPTLDWPYLYTYRQDPDTYYAHDVVDLSDPLNPVVYEDIYDQGNGVYTIIADDSELYVTVYEPAAVRLRMFDVSDPSQAVFVNSEVLQPFSEGYPVNMEMLHDRLLGKKWVAVQLGTGKISFFDVTDMSNVPPKQDYLYLGSSHIIDIEVYGSVLYVLRTYNDDYLLDALKITPSGPDYLMSLQLNGTPSMLEAHRTWLYYGMTNGEAMGIVNISSPESPSLAGVEILSYPETREMAATTDYLHFECEQAGVWSVDISTPDDPFKCGANYGVGAMNDMCINGDHMYMVFNTYIFKGGISVDISEPSEAHADGIFILSREGTDVTAVGQRMFVGCVDSKLMQIELTAPQTMHLVEMHDLDTAVASLAQTDAAEYVGLINSTIVIFNLYNWPNINPAGGVSVPGRPDQIICEGTAMYVMHDGVITTYSIADPLHPSSYSTYTPLGPAKEISVGDGYLYIATAGTLEIANLANPLNPSYLSSVADPNSPAGHHLAYETQSVLLRPQAEQPPTPVLVWPPDSPTVLDPLYPPSEADYCLKVIVNDGYLYEMCGPGLRIWDLY